MSRFINWLRQEVREIFPIWLFFFLFFALLAITRSALLGEYDIKPGQPSEYFIGSLIMAKVVVLVDALLKKKWLRNRPLIVATLWNTLLYFAAALIVHHLEQVWTFVRHDQIG